jgi:16S rRNA (adenine1518-N6/adenine1519-N6)-dimethyltransferase
VSSNRPKKSLGQHFLHDENIAHKIVNSLNAGHADYIIEIGPGNGVLTKYLFNRNEPPVIAIEIDNEKVEFLRNEFKGKETQIIHNNFLKYDLSVYTGPVAIIGNFPYNISSQIFFRILENRGIVNEIVCMIQKEVAERISAGPGTKTYGILSVLLQAFYNIEFLFRVMPEVFFPRPKVHSAVIRLTRNNIKELNCDEKLFFNIVKACFNQRRKTIRNSIKKITDKPLVASDLLSKRPEQLNVEQFEELTRIVRSAIQPLESGIDRLNRIHASRRPGWSKT